MRKYHISPTTGRPNLCKASTRACPLAGEGEHYATREEASAAYEKKMQSDVHKSHTKKPSPQEKVAQARQELDLLKNDLDKLSEMYEPHRRAVLQLEADLELTRDFYRQANTTVAKNAVKAQALEIKAALNVEIETHKDLAAKWTNAGEKHFKAAQKYEQLVRKAAKPGPPVSTARLSWDGEARMFSVDRSDLNNELPSALVSRVNGAVAQLQEPEAHLDAENDVLYWDLKPVKTENNWRLRVYND